MTRKVTPMSKGCEGLVGRGGNPYGVLCYCVGNRGCRERLAVPPVIDRSSLRDGA